MNYSVLFRRFKSYRYIGANVASVFGVEHQTKLALDEDLFFINVDNKIEKLLIASDDDDETDLEWLQSNYYGKKSPNQEGRENKIGLSEYDFVNYAYPKLNHDFRNWWNKKLIESDHIDPLKSHILFITNLYNFPWALLPLKNGVAIGRKFSVSCSHSELFQNINANNDSLLMTNGKLDSDCFDTILGSDLKRTILGSDLKRKLALHGAPGLWNRGGDESNPHEIGKKAMRGIPFVKLQTVDQITTEISGRDQSKFLPSIWIHEGHGHEYGLEIDGESQSFLRGKEILNHLNSVGGIIDFCWLGSCHSIELVHNSKIMQSKKVKTLLGHLGVGDEEGSVVAFEMLVLERIMRGYSVGRAVQLAKSALDPKMSASGSFTLLGDPRLVFFP